MNLELGQTLSPLIIYPQLFLRLPSNQEAEFLRVNLHSQGNSQHISHVTNRHVLILPTEACLHSEQPVVERHRKEIRKLVYFSVAHHSHPVNLSICQQRLRLL